MHVEQIGLMHKNKAYGQMPVKQVQVHFTLNRESMGLSLKLKEFPCDPEGVRVEVRLRESVLEYTDAEGVDHPYSETDVPLIPTANHHGFFTSPVIFQEEIFAGYVEYRAGHSELTVRRLPIPANVNRWSFSRWYGTIVLTKALDDTPSERHRDE